MKNFIFACVAVVVIICITAVVAFMMDDFTDALLELISTGKHREALEYYYRKEIYLSLAVGGTELERLEESLIDLCHGIPGAKEKAVSVCKELASRERLISY